jgi:hypothetical protein
MVKAVLVQTSAGVFTRFLSDIWVVVGIYIYNYLNYPEREYNIVLAISANIN